MTDKSLKKLRCIQRSVDRHWVGDGFPVRTLFAYPTVPEGHTTTLVVLRGTLRVNGSEEIGAAEVGIFDRERTKICIAGAKDVTALLLAGEPIDERIVGQGPFVMNSPQKIRQAMVDYQSGRMGRLS